MKRTLVIVLLLTASGCGADDDRCDRARRDLSAGRFVEARETLTRAYGDKPGPARAALLLASAHRECGNARASVALLGSIRAPDDESAGVIEEKVRVLLALSANERELRRKKLAAAALRQAGQLVRPLARKGGRSDPDVLLLAADVEARLGRRGVARSMIEEARLAGATEVAAETTEILILAGSGALEDAVARLEALLAKHGDSADALFALAKLHLAKGDTARGRQELERAIRVEPAHPRAAVRLGKLFMRLGRTKEAIEAVRPHVERRPDELSGLLTFAQALVATEQWAEAVETMRHAVSIYPNEPAVVNNLGVTLFEGSLWKNEWLAEAIRTHESALKITPGDVMNAYNLARCLTKKRSNDDMLRSIEIYDSLLLRTRGDPLLFALRRQIHRNVALILSDTFKRWEEAFTHYVAFFEMGGEPDEGVLDEWGKVLEGLGEPYRAPPPPNPEKHR